MPAAYDATQAECFKSVGVDLARDQQAIQAAYQLKASAEADPRVVDAAKTWSSCMGELGYDYPNPDAMRESFYAQPDDLETQFELEKRVAVANVGCELAYREVFRSVVVDRFGEYETALNEPITVSTANG